MQQRFLPYTLPQKGVGLIDQHFLASPFLEETIARKSPKQEEGPRYAAVPGLHIPCETG